MIVFENANAAQPLVRQNDDIMVIYQPQLDRAAEEILRVYPNIRQELIEFFGWDLDIRPQVVLVADTVTFHKLSRSKHYVAYALPARNLIVIDYSKMNIHPFTLNTTLKHELCHLMLHRHIPNGHLPKWLDEGVCQWVSDGIGEILINKDWSGLDTAVMTGQIIPLRRLTEYFPGDKASLMLSYEQSKSVVSFIDRQYGYNAIMETLDFLRHGETVETALLSSLELTLTQLENQWRDHLESTPRWLVFLANHIYAILFFLAAVLTFFGFIRLLLKRKKVYEKWEAEEDNED